MFPRFIRTLKSSFTPLPSSLIPNETEIKLPAAHNRLGTSPSLPVLEPIGLERFFLDVYPKFALPEAGILQEDWRQGSLGAVKHFGNTGSED